MIGSCDCGTNRRQSGPMLGPVHALEHLIGSERRDSSGGIQPTPRKNLTLGQGCKHRSCFGSSGTGFHLKATQAPPVECPREYIYKPSSGPEYTCGQESQTSITPLATCKGEDLDHCSRTGLKPHKVGVSCPTSWNKLSSGD